VFEFEAFNSKFLVYDLTNCISQLFLPPVQILNLTKPLPMSFLKKLRPYSSKHSIKEAVITLFFEVPFEQVEEIGKELKDALSAFFQEMHLAGSLKIKVAPEGKGISVDERKPVGFRLLRKEGEELKYVLQGFDDDNSNRTFLSFHTLDYPGWQSFYDRLLSILEVFDKKFTDKKITAFSLHYIDEFEWDSAENVPLKKIFNKKNDYLPAAFFIEGGFPNLDLTIAETKSQDTTYFNRIIVSIVPTEKPTISISHNATRQLREPRFLSKVLTEQTFQELLDDAHSNNVKMLSKLLAAQVQSLIKLPNNYQ
jgi:uncharacterized protein (TIGR04255 family)